VFEPEPEIKPVRLPRQLPKRVVPSYIGESGQVGNWLFYKGAGDTLYDFSGKENHGDIKGAKWTDKEQAGWALDFDGVDDYVDTPTTHLYKNFTISVWVKVDSWDVNRPVVSDNYLLDCIYINTNGVAQTEVNTQSWKAVAVGGDITDGEWHHIVAVGYEENNDTHAEIYFDGSIVDSSERVDDPRKVQSWDGYYLGYDAIENTYFNGSIDDVRIYNRALSDTEIKKIYEGEKVMFK